MSDRGTCSSYVVNLKKKEKEKKKIRVVEINVFSRVVPHEKKEKGA